MDGPNIATASHIEEVYRFSERWAKAAHSDPATANLVVHCFAGISRSSAIALIPLLLYYRSEKAAAKRLYEINRWAAPNTHVLYLTPRRNFIFAEVSIAQSRLRSRDWYGSDCGFGFLIRRPSRYNYPSALQPLFGNQVCCPAHEKRSIINVASVSGIMAGYSPHAYTAAKFGVVGLTKSVALELSSRGIRVNAICPGHIATAIFSGVLPEMPTDLIERAPAIVEPWFAEVVPLGRGGLPANIANVALWLASSESVWPPDALNQSLQIIGVTNVASNQAIIAIPLPTER